MAKMAKWHTTRLQQQQQQQKQQQQQQQPLQTMPQRAPCHKGSISAAVWDESLHRTVGQRAIPTSPVDARGLRLHLNLHLHLGVHVHARKLTRTGSMPQGLKSHWPKAECGGMLSLNCNMLSSQIY